MAVRSAANLTKAVLSTYKYPSACFTFRRILIPRNSPQNLRGPSVTSRSLSFGVILKDEVEKAKEAARQAQKDLQPTIFTKIINKEIPTKIVYEDDQCLAFEDVAPQAPCHVLVIPKRQLPMLSDATDEDAALLGRLLVVAKKVADIKQLAEGFRVVINNGEHGSQSVYHLHLHVLGGKQMGWPPF